MTQLLTPVTTLDATINAACEVDIPLLDYEPAPADVRGEAIAGLSREQKQLPCKLFYDRRGSLLFDRICQLPEYYPTRTELAILRDNARAIRTAIGPDAALVEYGSGSSMKTPAVLGQLTDPVAYVPIDISRQHLIESSAHIKEQFPDLAVLPVCVDYTQTFDLPHPAYDAARITAWFPGSTIGNFERAQALSFLRSIRTTCGSGSGLLIGVDLKKDPAILHAAYNDSAGVTAAFNLNILRRLNLDLHADFDLSAYVHHAFYNVPKGRMEMHLVSMLTQIVHLGEGIHVRIEEGESIHTESCCKYTIDEFAGLAHQAGYNTRRVWTDARKRFSVHYLIAD